jgi:transcriptional regulator with XRE-family HTH domain
MNEFQQTLINILQRRGMSVDDLAEQTGYNPLFFESILTGKSRQIPVDFFLRVARVLDLSEEEKDALVRSWAFGRAWKLLGGFLLSLQASAQITLIHIGAKLQS